jgi:exopolyphosphatase/guanosine-5'-triphosphate,3'-diphosphate pyrophosphatase
MSKKRQDEAIAFVSEIKNARDPDPAHGSQVTMLALSLFDELKSIHGLGKDERRLLEISALLHDIGWSIIGTESSGHHKSSGKLIRALDIPGLSKSDTSLCALIARYHTKAIPDALRHKRFALFSAKKRDTIEWLAGMLRVADAFDCRHLKTVRGIACAINGSTLKIKLECLNNDCGAEIGKAVEKQSLLVKKTGKNIEYICP